MPSKYTNIWAWAVSHALSNSSASIIKQRKSLGSCFYKTYIKVWTITIVWFFHNTASKKNRMNDVADSSVQFINKWARMDVSLRSCSSFVLRLLFSILMPDTHCAVYCITFHLLPPSSSVKSIYKKFIIHLKMNTLVNGDKNNTDKTLFCVVRINSKYVYCNNRGCVLFLYSERASIEEIKPSLGGRFSALSVEKWK